MVSPYLHLQNNYAMIVKPERAETSSTFRRVQSLRNTNDFVLFARACCNGNLDLLTRLGECHLGPLQISDVTCPHKAKMKGYIESADALGGRIQNLIDLVSLTQPSIEGLTISGWLYLNTSQSAGISESRS
jgi:hypothetical protein